MHLCISIRGLVGPSVHGLQKQKEKLATTPKLRIQTHLYLARICFYCHSLSLNLLQSQRSFQFLEDGKSIENVKEGNFYEISGWIYKLVGLPHTLSRKRLKAESGRQRKEEEEGKRGRREEGRRVIIEQNLLNPNCHRGGPFRPP